MVGDQQSGYLLNHVNGQDGKHSTVVMVRSLKVVPVSQEGPDGLLQTVFVGFFGPLVKENVGNQTRVSAVLYILR